MNLLSVAVKALSPATMPAAVFAAASANAVFVFNYHEISERPSRFSQDFDLNVRPATFQRQLQWIKKHFNVISAADLIAGDYATPAALITFDDGFRSAFREGGDALVAAALPATIFMNMAAVKGETFWAGLVTYLTRHCQAFARFIARKYGRPMDPLFFLRCTRADVDQFVDREGNGAIAQAAEYAGEFATLDDLQQSGTRGLSLGNHLFNHHNAAAIPLAELEEQYVRNDEAMAPFANRVRLFSYPFGQPGTCYTRETDALLLSLGALRLFTAYPLRNSDRGARRLHRVSMFEYVDTESTFKSQAIVPALLNQILTRRRHSYV